MLFQVNCLVYFLALHFYFLVHLTYVYDPVSNKFVVHYTFLAKLKSFDRYVCSAYMRSSASLSAVSQLSAEAALSFRPHTLKLKRQPLSYRSNHNCNVVTD